MQDMPPIKLLLNALDPAGELNTYDDDADNLKLILQANDCELVNVITHICNDESSKFSMATEVQQLLKRITEFLDGKVFVTKQESKKEVKKESEVKEEKIDGKHPRPRGAAPKGKKWDHDTGAWVTDDDGDGAVTKKKEWPRPRGAAPLSDKGEKQEWDSELGWWVVCAEQPPKKRKGEVLEVQSDKFPEVQSDKFLKTDKAAAEDQSVKTDV